jgi:hypothetical protein
LSCGPVLSGAVVFAQARLRNVVLNCWQTGTAR